MSRYILLFGGTGNQRLEMQIPPPLYSCEKKKKKKFIFPCELIQAWGVCASGGGGGKELHSYKAL